MSSDGRIGAELEPVLVQAAAPIGLANTLTSAQGASAQGSPNLVQWLAIALFMFGFPAALFGMFFAGGYSWTFWATIGIASLVIPPLLIVVTYGGARPSGTRH